MALLLAALWLAGCAAGAGGQSGQSVQELAVGDCFDAPGGNFFVEVTPRPCAAPHSFELYAVIAQPEPPGAPYPGEAELRLRADEQCLSAFAPYVGRPYADSALHFAYFHPTLASWSERQDRTLLCLLTLPDKGRLEGSMRGSAR